MERWWWWKTGNRTFLSSGKYMNGKKHGEFRKYDSEGNFQDDNFGSYQRG